MAHARLSPSDSTRWINCDLAIALDDLAREKGEIVERDSEAATAGTNAHDYGTLLIERNLAGEEEISDKILKAWKLCDEEHAERAELYAERIDELVRGFKHSEIVIEVEQQVPLWYEPGKSGTVDFSLYDPRTATLVIVDLKSGYQPVTPYRNPQLMIYARARADLVELFHGPVEKFRLGLCQPAQDEEIQWWEIEAEELERFRRIVSQRALDHDDPLLPPIGRPSDKACQWCIHRATCEPRSRSIQEKLTGSATDRQLTPEEIDELYSQRKLVEKWFEDLEGHMRSHMDDFPGWELRPGNVRRIGWTEDSALDLVAEALVNEWNVEPWRLKTPAEIASELGKTNAPAFYEEFAENVATAQNKPSLVPVKKKG